MGSLVFVTPELSPFTAGGIGRVIHNLLRTMSDEERSRSIVLLLDQDLDVLRFETLFPGCRLICLDTMADSERHAESGHHAPKWAFRHGSFHFRSSAVYRALRILAKETQIEYVEFPDWGGLAFCAIQEKRLRNFLFDATFAIRLHSTEAILASEEMRHVSPEALLIGDLERKSLRDCDKVIAQLPTIGDLTRSRFGLSLSDWSPRVYVHAPPVLLDTRETVNESNQPGAAQPILFTSKFQRIKSPEVFISGVCDFFRRCPLFVGQAVFCAHSFDTGYSDEVRSLIPPDLSSRFVFLPRLSSTEREALIGAGIVVFPNKFESFCLAAYEASLLGGRVILNGGNVAFGADTPWRDGANCFKYDGGARGLSLALERCWRSSDRLAPVIVPASPSPWRETRSSARKIRADVAEPMVSVVIAGTFSSEGLSETLSNIAEQSYSEVEIIIVSELPGDPLLEILLERLEGSRSASVRVVRLSRPSGLAQALNAGLRAAGGEYVLPLQVGDRVDPRFLKIAVAALEENRDFGMVVPQVGLVGSGEYPALPGEMGDFQGYQTYLGESFLAGRHQNVLAPLTTLFRTNVLCSLGYNEWLDRGVDWDVALRASRSDVRSLVASDVFIYCPGTRPGSAAEDETSDRVRLHGVLMSSEAVGSGIAMDFLADCAKPPEIGDFGRNHRGPRIVELEGSVRELEDARENYFIPRLSELEKALDEQIRVKHEYFLPRIEQLERSLRELEEAKDEFFVPRIEHLERRLEESERIKQTWFLPRISELEQALAASGGREVDSVYTGL